MQFINNYMWNIPDQIKDIFSNSKLPINGDSEEIFFVDINRTENIPQLYFLEELLGLDFSMNIEGQIAITADLKFLTIKVNKDPEINPNFLSIFEHGKDDDNFHIYDFWITPDEAYSIIRKIYEIGYSIKDIHNEVIPYRIKK